MFALALVALVGAAPAAAVTIEFNYDYDATGFFGTATAPTPARRALEFAARAFTSFADALAPIAPAGSDAWTAQFPNPATGQSASIVNLAVPADQLTVFVGARNLAGSRLAEATPGSHLFDDPEALSPEFLSAVVNRGQGSPIVDSAPWGGSIAFDTTTSDGAPRPWHFDPQTAPSFPANDFVSVASHELAHLLGFGASVSPSFQAKVMGGRFAGPTTSAVFGGSVLLHSDGDHWATSVASPPFTVNPPPAAMGPLLFPGERLALTPLDYAALADVGWDVPQVLLELPGDVDADADVDGADLLAWQRGLGVPGASAADVNGDQRVDDFDGWIIRNYFGALATMPDLVALAPSTAPEPGAALLMTIAVVAALPRAQPDKGWSRRRTPRRVTS
jgi:hypothetical protein